MSKPFSHPLARHAKVWPASGTKGKGGRVLVVVTTLELDAQSRKFKADKVKRLSDEAAKWVSGNPEQATSYMLVSRPKDWGEGTDAKQYPTGKNSMHARS